MRLLLSVLFIFFAGCSDIVAPQEYYPFEIETRLEQDENGYYHFPIESYSSTQALIRFTAHTHNPEIQFVYWDCDTQFEMGLLGGHTEMVDIINHASYTGCDEEAHTMFGPWTELIGDTVKVSFEYTDSWYGVYYRNEFSVILKDMTTDEE